MTKSKQNLASNLPKYLLHNPSTGFSFFFLELPTNSSLKTSFRRDAMLASNRCQVKCTKPTVQKYSFELSTFTQKFHGKFSVKRADCSKLIAKYTSRKISHIRMTVKIGCIIHHHIIMLFMQRHRIVMVHETTMKIGGSIL
jgi:hypothetical protein